MGQEETTEQVQKEESQQVIKARGWQQGDRLGETERLEMYT